MCDQEVMEFHLSFSTTVLSIFVILAIAFLLQILRRKKINIVKKRAAPQAKGSWPIIGHLHLLGGSRPPHQVLGDMADKYGPIFTIKLGVHQVLVVSSGDLAKECFTTNDKAFASRPKSKAVEIMLYNYATFGLAPYGDYWRQVRKIVMLEILSQKRVEMLGDVRVHEVRASTKDIYEAWLKNKDNEGEFMKVDMTQWFGNLVFNILARIISGKRFQLNDEEGVRFQNAARKLFELLGAFVVSDFIPFTNYIDLGGYEKEMKMTAKEMDDILEGWLNTRKREKKRRKQREDDQVFMDMMISILQDASEKDFPGYDHDTVIKSTCLALITAGSESTSVTLTWALSLLLNNPNALKIAQDEIDEHVGRGRLVEETDIKNLVYLDAIIKETMRLYPAGPLSLPHESMDDCIVSGYNIPTGTRLLAVEIMAYNYATFPLAPYGDYWRQVRKIVMFEMLSQKRVEMLGDVRVHEVRASTKEIYEAWLKNKDNEGEFMKVDMKQWFGNLVFNILGRIVSGKRFRLNDEEGVRFQNAARKLFELLGAFVVSDFIPFTNYIDIGGYEKEMKMTGKEIDDIVEGWLNTRKREKKRREQREDDQVFMDMMISILQDASEKDFPGYDHDTIIKSTCLGLIIAGSDTTSVTLTWALSLLLNNPNALKIAQDEIDEHVGRDRLVEETDIKNLVYLDAIIKETMRLYPAGPLSLPHESMDDCIVSGYNIPTGTRLLVNLWKIHRDPNIWSDPHDFKPERFLTSQKDIDLKGKHFELLPFGSGRRMCPGVSLALRVLSLALANLIQQFVINKPSNEPIDMTESLGLTSSKATPLEVLLAPRLSEKLYHVGA
uniref:Putative cytochrome P450 n=1 Tax=Helianthus annuus TaxID=4232 RepID=A0A251V9U3_HELAN